ncbi:MAG: hypothetical protein AB1641_22745 [Thermodesulfobacteriota bacterium]
MSTVSEPGSTRYEVRLEVVRPGAAPVCLETGCLPCRGCPGWRFMLTALLDPEGVWGDFPIHCGCTGLTVKMKT